MAEKKAKPQEPAGYCTTAVLANLFDITSQWVGELTKNGILRKHVLMILRFNLPGLLG